VGVRDLCGYPPQLAPKCYRARLQLLLILLLVTGAVCSCWAVCGSFKPLVVGSTPTAPTTLTTVDATNCYRRVAGPNPAPGNLSQKREHEKIWLFAERQVDASGQLRHETLLKRRGRVAILFTM